MGNSNTSFEENLQSKSSNIQTQHSDIDLVITRINTEADRLIALILERGYNDRDQICKKIGYQKIDELSGLFNTQTLNGVRYKLGIIPENTPDLEANKTKVCLDIVNFYVKKINLITNIQKELPNCRNMENEIYNNLANKLNSKSLNDDDWLQVYNKIENFNKDTQKRYNLIERELERVRAAKTMRELDAIAYTTNTILNDTNTICKRHENGLFQFSDKAEKMMPVGLTSQRIVSPQPMSPEPMRSQFMPYERIVSPQPMRPQPQFMPYERIVSPQPIRPEPMRSRFMPSERIVSPQPIRSQFIPSERIVSPQPMRTQFMPSERIVSPQPMRNQVLSPQPMKSQFMPSQFMPSERQPMAQPYGLTSQRIVSPQPTKSYSMTQDYTNPSSPVDLTRTEVRSPLKSILKKERKTVTFGEPEIHTNIHKVPVTQRSIIQHEVVEHQIVHQTPVYQPVSIKEKTEIPIVPVERFPETIPKKVNYEKSVKVTAEKIRKTSSGTYIKNPKALEITRVIPKEHMGRFHSNLNPKEKIVKIEPIYGQKTKQNGVPVRAICNYDPQGPGEISLQKGQATLYLGTNQNGWSRVRHSNKTEGYVPHSYLSK